YTGHLKMSMNSWSNLRTYLKIKNMKKIT
ncbi:uncharacterized protein METZ01_LOCUS198986, partial [marine metagenome]